VPQVPINVLDKYPSLYIPTHNSIESSELLERLFPLL